jgi:hypothetical protein
LLERFCGVKDKVSEIEEKFARAAVLMQTALSRSTGLKEREQKLVTHWTLATHTLPHVNTFPLLALLGKTGCGKSTTLEIIGNFAYRPAAFSLRSMTAPTIRDKFADCGSGTAILEEADQAWKDSEATFERMLADRYQRRSAEAAHKVKLGENWGTESKKFFGATVLHRRIPFNDAALDGRTVFVRYRADHSRKYQDYNADDPWNVEGRDLIRNVVFEPPKVGQPEGVAGRIFATYKLLLSTAEVCGDQNFQAQLLPRLLTETAELKEAQSSEPDGLVLGAILEAVYHDDFGPDWGNIKYSVLTKSIWENHRFPLLPRQIGPMVRELGFDTKTSHGVTVVVPTPATLVKACDECEYTDDAIEKLRQELLGSDGATRVRGTER